MDLNVNQKQSLKTGLNNKLFITGILDQKIFIYNNKTMKIPIYDTKKCELCEKEFVVNIKNKISKKKRFCSGLCAKKSNGLNNKGKKRTDEFKDTLSKKLTGKGNPFFNKKHKNESIEKMKESSKWKEDRYKYCNMNDKEKEIFDGIMLSDGCLSSSRISSRLSLGFKHKNTLNRIIKDLKVY